MLAIPACELPQWNHHCIFYRQSYSFSIHTSNTRYLTSNDISSCKPFPFKMILLRIIIFRSSSCGIPMISDTHFFYISDACMKHKYCLVFSLPVQSTFSSSNWKPPWDCWPDSSWGTTCLSNNLLRQCTILRYGNMLSRLLELLFIIELSINVYV